MQLKEQIDYFEMNQFQSELELQPISFYTLLGSLSSSYLIHRWNEQLFLNSDAHAGWIGKKRFRSAKAWYRAKGEKIWSRCKLNRCFKYGFFFIFQKVGTELEAVNKAYHACLTCLKDKDSKLEDAHSQVECLQAEAMKLVEVVKQVSRFKFRPSYLLVGGLSLYHFTHTVQTERCRFGTERDWECRPRSTIVNQGRVCLVWLHSSCSLIIPCCRMEQEIQALTVQLHIEKALSKDLTARIEAKHSGIVDASTQCHVKGKSQLLDVSSHLE